MESKPKAFDNSDRHGPEIWPGQACECSSRGERRGHPHKETRDLGGAKIESEKTGTSVTCDISKPL
jgi:hypothetical protein